jgi:hypothetical protein
MEEALHSSKHIGWNGKEENAEKSKKSRKKAESHH